MKIGFGVLTLGVLGAGMLPQQAWTQTHYRLGKSIPLAGDGFWDYAATDTEGRRLYLTHNTLVHVLDLDTGVEVGTVPGIVGGHGVAIARDLDRGFATSGRDSTVVVFSLGTLAAVGQVRNTGANPDAVLYEPTTHRVFTFNGGSGNATAIDANTLQIVGTVALDGKPEFAVADGQGKVFVNNEDKSLLVEFDAQSLAVEQKWTLPRCEEPTGLAFDRAHRRLFVACGNRAMLVVSADDGKVVARLPTGAGTDAAAFDPETRLAFASNGAGTLTVVRQLSPDKYQVVQQLRTERGARTMALDLQTHRVYLPTARFGPPPKPTKAAPRPWPTLRPGSFHLVVADLGKDGI